MKDYFETLIAWRKLILEITSGLDTGQLNLIPQGHANNVIWNMGHLVTVSENILYKHSANQRPEHGFDTGQFGKGTRPGQPIAENEVQMIRRALRETFTDFKSRQGLTITTIANKESWNSTISEQALQFLLMHEHMHYQTIVQLIGRLADNTNK